MINDVCKVNFFRFWRFFIGLRLFEITDHIIYESQGIVVLPLCFSIFHNFSYRFPKEAQGHGYTSLSACTRR